MAASDSASVGDVYVDVHPDAKQFLDRLKTALEKVKDPGFKVKAAPDVTGFNKDLQAKLKALAAVSTKVTAVPDVSGLNKELRAKLAALTAVPVKVRADPDMTGFRARLRTAVSGVAAVSVGINAHPDLTGFRAKLLAALRAMPNASVAVNLTMPTARAAGARIGREAARVFVAAFNTAMGSASWGTPGPSSGQSGSAGARSGSIYGRTFAAGVREALANLPEPNIGVATTQAEQDVRDLQASLRRLGDERVGVTISSAEALREVRTIQAEIARLRAQSPVDVQVDADLAAAQLRLAQLHRQLDQIGRERTNVRVDVDSSPLRALTALLLGSTSRMQLLASAGILLGPAIVPAAAAATAAIGALGGMLASVVAGAGVGILALSGVVGAVKALGDASREQAKTGATLATQDKQLATGADQVRSAVASLANTRQNAALSAERSARSIEDSERSLAVAQRDALRAQQDITRAREDAQDALEDLNSSLASNATSIKQANLDLADAEAALAKVRNLPADNRQRVEAEIAYERAKQQIDDLTTRQGRLREEKARSDKAGIEGSEQVVAAQEKYSDSQERVRAAERAVQDARRDAAEQARQNAYSIQQAQEAVVAAQRAAATAAVTTAATAGSAADTLREKLDSLSPAAQRFAQFLFGLRGSVLDLRRASEEAFLPGLQQAVTNLLPSLPGLVGFIEKMGQSLGRMADQGTRALTGPKWEPFFSYMDRSAVPTMEQLAHSVGNVALGIANLVVAFEPAQRQLGGGIEDLTAKFARWSASLDGNASFQRFIDYAISRGPTVIDALSAIADMVVHIGEAAAPVGDVVLAVLGGIADAISAIPVDVLTGVVAGLAAFRVAGLVAPAVIALGAALRGLATGAITASAAAGGLVATLGGPVTIAVAAVAVAIGLFVSNSVEAKREADQLKGALVDLSIAYRRSAEDGGQAVNALIAHNEALKTLIVNARSLGLTIGDVTAVTEGDTAARERAVAAYDAEIRRLEGLLAGYGLASAGGRAHIKATDEMSAAGFRNEDQLRKAIDTRKGEKAALVESTAEAAKNAEMQRVLAEALERDREAFRGLHPELQANIRASADLAPKIAALQSLYDTLSDRTATAAQRASALRQAIDALTRGKIDAIEAEERMVASLGALDSAMANNSAGFDLNTAKSAENRQQILQNRDALEAALQASRDKAIADVAAGVSLDEATAANRRRIDEILREIPESQRNTKAVQDLTAAYGSLDGTYNVNLKTTGAEAVFQQLQDLKIAQMALDLNISIQDARQRVVGGNSRAAARHAGGPIHGPGGPTDDLVPAILPTPGGPMPYRLSDGEWVHRAAAVDYYGPGAMQAINEMKVPRDRLLGGVRRASGGPVLGDWPFNVDALGTFVPSLAEVQSKVIPSFGPWPSSPDAQRGDSGVWRAIVKLIESTGPVSGSFGNAYRHGDPLWHGCVPMDTEILTRRGWVRYEDVRAGDETIGYNPATGLSEWTRIVGMHHYVDAELWTIEADGWSADVTPGHKWLTDDGLVETRHLTDGSRVRLSTPADDDTAGFGVTDGDRRVSGVRKTAVRTADVWCPTTELGTWTAQQGGRVFLTGNSGRAVDWMGFNQDLLARFLAGKKPLELIHRTNSADYAYTRGVNQGSFGEQLMEEHRNHIHIAMALGGLVNGLPRPRTYDSGGILPPGATYAYNGTGRDEYIHTEAQERALVGAAMARGGDTYVLAGVGPEGLGQLEAMQARRRLHDQIGWPR